MINVRSERTNLWLFFGLTLVFSWVFWGIAVLMGLQGTKFPGVLFFVAGGTGPMVAVLFLLFRGQSEQRSDFWSRVFQISRISWKWWLVILLFFPVLNALSHVIAGWINGNVAGFNFPTEVFANPLSIFAFLLTIFILGPIPEELGWRGYALDRLQLRWSALSSSLILGFVWAIWHIPLFAIPGTYQNQMAFGGLPFWLFLVNPVLSSVLFTWIYNNTDRSILSAILFHFSINFSGELFGLSVQARVVQLILLAASIILVILIWGKEDLSQEEKKATPSV